VPTTSRFSTAPRPVCAEFLSSPPMDVWGGERAQWRRQYPRPAAATAGAAVADAAAATASAVAAVAAVSAVTAPPRRRQLAPPPCGAGNVGSCDPHICHHQQRLVRPAARLEAPVWMNCHSLRNLRTRDSRGGAGMRPPTIVSSPLVHSIRWAIAAALAASAITGCRAAETSTPSLCSNAFPNRPVRVVFLLYMEEFAPPPRSLLSGSRH